MGNVSTMTTLPLVVAAVVVSVVHGLLPNHWAPFVLIGRAQKWSLRKMLGVLVLAGAAHIAIAGVLALATLLVGIAVMDHIGDWAHTIPGLILLGFGITYVVVDLVRGESHQHHHDVHVAAREGMSDRTATTTLILLLALSPCEAMVPVFVSAAPTGDPLFLVLLVVLAGIASLGVMTAAAVLAWLGMARISFGWVAHHERLVMGLILGVIGLATLLLGHAGHEH
jgi:putative Mn2+ efflux pump MntP